MPEESNRSGQDGQLQQVVKKFIAKLSEEERMLVLLQGELYEGSWEAMLEDLENRLEGRPYIFKLVNRIRDDIERIHSLQKFEEKHNLRLSDYIQPPSEHSVEQ